jgi:gliding motility-associated-like protein
MMLFCCEAKTQTEYITNGSFEQIDSCYGTVSYLGFDVFQWTGCKGWSNPIASSSDLWCTNPKFGPYSTPGALPGFQYPNTGSNYAGFLFTDKLQYSNYREYIQNKLVMPLTNGNNYEISFYVSSTVYECNISQIGIKFFNQKLVDLSRYNLVNELADVTNDAANFITDTLGWKKIILNYKANGTEHYMVIGCFLDSLHVISNNCDTTNGSGLVFPNDYLYIDDVSIKEIEPLAPVIPNVFTPNNDLVNDVWQCDFLNFETVNCLIYNRWGNLIFQSNKQIIQWDGRTTSGNNCEDGVYFYCIETETEKHKGHIQLIR